MPDSLDLLYDALGTPAAARPVRPAPKRAATGLESLSRAEGDDRATSGDMEALDAAGIQQLQHELRAHPDMIVERARRAFGTPLSAEELDAALQRAKGMLHAPKQGLESLNAERALPLGPSLPAEFDFDGYDPNEISIDVSSRKFEEMGDLLGWIINSGRWALGPPIGDTADFRWHDRSISGFTYDLVTPPNGKLSITLFSDFGTGLYHSRYIAKHIRRAACPYAIHLGDVYYSGRQAEFKEYFSSVLEPMLAADTTQLFTMNGNHEMFSKARPFFSYIEDRKRRYPKQLQQGSYFCLRGDRAQIIGVDTDFFGYRRYRQPDLVAWLRQQLQRGRQDGLTNILLTGDEPYEYGSASATALYDLDLKWAAPLIDLWFWGNTHYCALFAPSSAFPFFGSCIGHGGFPYARASYGRIEPAPLLWLETGARFPAWTGVRQDRGNNGFCVLTIDADAIRLAYRDWMARDRCQTTLIRAADGRLSLGRVDGS